ncbi:MAG: hypothetical protein GY950_16670 [bacterium]|nr:hypothetical protein [bacterium]
MDEDTGGDLSFDPRVMIKINVTFDKDFLPREKVLKLNLRGARFFNEIKRDIREINGVYVVYPHIYAFQLDTRKEEWEKKLTEELNHDYKLELQNIRFFDEEEVCGIYQRAGLNAIRDPYHLQEGELLIIAGGFANFNAGGMAMCGVTADVSAAGGRGKGGEHQAYKGNYYAKFSDKAGAYFYVGGEWYHNLFVPEFFHKEEPRFFSFRIADDGKNLKFFGDSIKRGIDIRGKIKTKTTKECEKIIHTINPDYLSGTRAKELVLSVCYYIEEGEEPPVEEDMVERMLKNLETDVFGEKDNKNIPYLENAMILLPAPHEKDIPSYIMTIGEENKGIRFYASSSDKEISILPPGKEEEIYKKKIKDKIHYTVKPGRFSYTISNRFLSRFVDKELSIYFSWALSNTMESKILLDEDFYIFGRNPFGNIREDKRNRIKEHLVKLNEGSEDFWRIGTSRNHAILIKDAPGSFRVYNISSSFPVYVVNKGDLEKPVIAPFRIDPVKEDKKKKKVQTLLSRLLEGKIKKNDLATQLKANAGGVELENSDLIIIGNRGYNFIAPLVMESQLSSRMQMSVLRKIRESSSVLTT